MTWNETTQQYVLHTGKTLKATAGILGICDDAGQITIFEGADGYLSEARGFTADERLELVSYMIDLWARFAESPH